MFRILIRLFVPFLLQAGAMAQLPTIDVGSDGTYGPINITENTRLQIPPDGIFHATTVNVAQGAQLSFTRNLRNTPVYILAQGDVTLDGEIFMSATGRGGAPGGFDGGFLDSDGYGPGGGSHDPQVAVQLYDAGSVTSYTSPLLIPLVGGSGGAGSTATADRPSSGGGGALLLASNSQIVVGAEARLFNFNGFNPRFRRSQLAGDGSGGCYRMVAPTVTFNGVIGFGGAPERTRIDRFQGSGGPSADANHTYGANFIIFPDPAPTLEVIELAGEAVDPSTGIALVQLPVGTDPNTKVRLRASNFGKSIPISIVLQPENGNRTIIETTIDNSSEDPVEQEYDITLPVNVTTQVFVWTR